MVTYLLYNLHAGGVKSAEITLWSTNNAWTASRKHILLNTFNLKRAKVRRKFYKHWISKWGNMFSILDPEVRTFCSLDTCESFLYFFLIKASWSKSLWCYITSGNRAESPRYVRHTDFLPNGIFLGASGSVRLTSNVKKPGPLSIVFPWEGSARGRVIWTYRCSIVYLSDDSNFESIFLKWYYCGSFS
jgi:hypothetical protein